MRIQLVRMVAFEELVPAADRAYATTVIHYLFNLPTGHSPTALLYNPKLQNYLGQFLESPQYKVESTAERTMMLQQLILRLANLPNNVFIGLN